MPSKPQAMRGAQREPPLTNDDLADLRKLRKLFAPMLAGDPHAPAVVIDEHWVSVTTAMAMFGVKDRKTMIGRIERHGLGRKVGPRWIVNVAAYRSWQKNGGRTP